MASRDLMRVYFVVRPEVSSRDQKCHVMIMSPSAKNDTTRILLFTDHNHEIHIVLKVSTEWYSITWSHGKLRALPWRNFFMISFYYLRRPTGFLKVTLYFWTYSRLMGHTFQYFYIPSYHIFILIVCSYVYLQDHDMISNYTSTRNRSISLNAVLRNALMYNVRNFAITVIVWLVIQYVFVLIFPEMLRKSPLVSLQNTSLCRTGRFFFRSAISKVDFFRPWIFKSVASKLSARRSMITERYFHSHTLIRWNIFV